MNLSDTLQCAAANGLDCLNIWSLGAEWQANVKLKGSAGFSVRFDTDIVTSIEKVLRPLLGTPEPPPAGHFRPDPLTRLKAALDELNDAVRGLTR